MLLAPCPACRRNDIGEARQARMSMPHEASFGVARLLRLSTQRVTSDRPRNSGSDFNLP